MPTIRHEQIKSYLFSDLTDVAQYAGNNGKVLIFNGNSVDVIDNVFNKLIHNERWKSIGISWTYEEILLPNLSSTGKGKIALNDSVFDFEIFINSNLNTTEGVYIKDWDGVAVPPTGLEIEDDILFCKIFIRKKSTREQLSFHKNDINALLLYDANPVGSPLQHFSIVPYYYDEDQIKQFIIPSELSECNFIVGEELEIRLNETIKLENQLPTDGLVNNERFEFKFIPIEKLVNVTFSIIGTNPQTIKVSDFFYEPHDLNAVKVFLNDIEISNGILSKIYNKSNVLHPYFEFEFDNATEEYNIEVTDSIELNFTLKY